MWLFACVCVCVCVRACVHACVCVCMRMHMGLCEHFVIDNWCQNKQLNKQKRHFNLRIKCSSVLTSLSTVCNAFSALTLYFLHSVHD